MRKRICKRSIGLLALMQIAVLTLWGFGDIDETESQTLQPEVKDITEKKIVKTPDDYEYSSSDSDYVDLTILSSTVVYAEVYNMMYYPENFVGKTIRMQGIYSDFFDQAKGKHYYACIIMDATACCSQGIEFELTEDYSYPDEYPTDGDICTVEGVFEIYEEDGYQYCTLRNAKLIQQG